MTPRAYLFVPGHRPDRYDKALAAGADAVIIDLEDAVAPQDKAAARAALAAWLAARPTGVSGVVVRVNAADTPWFDDDLALCVQPAVVGVMLPKAERVQAVSAVTARRAALPVLPLIETAFGLAQVQTLAAAPGVQRLAFGSIDFQVDLGLRGATEDDLLPYRAQIVLASRLAGLLPPIDGVSVAFDDAEALRADVQRARRLGFGAKLCIHPSQVAAARSGFAPSAEELAWAQRVLKAAQAAQGAAVAVDGKMVDKPVLLRAQAIVRDAAA